MSFPWRSAESDIAQPDMVENVAQQLSAAGHFSRLEEHVFPNADHFICGTGADPVRADARDRSADALAAGQSFDDTIAFLKRWLN
jgi:hypothetical protein